MNRSAFIATLRSPRTQVFGASLNRHQKEGIEAILDAMLVVGDGRAGTLSLALAIAYDQTDGRMAPLEETGVACDGLALAACGVPDPEAAAKALVLAVIDGSPGAALGAGRRWDMIASHYCDFLMAVEDAGGWCGDVPQAMSPAA